MKIKFIIFTLLIFACQTKPKQETKEQSIENIDSSAVASDIQCDQEICIQLINHDESQKSFDIYMSNSTQVAGFQCDFSTINVISSNGGILNEHGYQTSTNGSRVLSFSMQAKLIDIGEGILTTINYSGNPTEICMSGIIFAGMGANQLSNNNPSCLNLN